MEAYENRSPARLWVEGLAGEIGSLGRAHMPLPGQRFCIFGQGRTGSTLLTTLLDSHPDIRCQDEILRRPRLMPMNYLDRVSRGMPMAFGFHLKPYHLTRFQRVSDLSVFLQDLTERGWSLIHLTRRDPVAHAFSSVYAKHHGWHRRGEAGTEAVPLIEVNPEKFTAKVLKRRRWVERECEALRNLEVFEICYEDHLLHQGPREQRLLALLEHLGLPPAPLTTPLRKSVRHSPWELMANPEAVRSALVRAGIEMDREPGGERRFPS